MKVLKSPTFLVLLGFVVVGVVLSLLFGGQMTSPKPSFAAEPLFALGPIRFTNSMLMTLLVIIGLVAFFASVTRRMSLVPGRRQSFVEALVEFLVGLAEGTAGKKTGRMIFPLVATLFIFIITANYSALLPGVGSIGTCADEHFIHQTVDEQKAPETAPAEGGSTAGNTTTTEAEEAHSGPCKDHPGTVFVPFFRAPNADLNTTVAMALIAVVLVQILGIRAHGIGGYAKELATPAFLTPVHVMGEISRVISLSARLFGNVFGGEVLLAVMYFLLGSVFAGFGVVIFLGLELLFGAIQALVFAFLTTVYISIAVAGHGDDHGHDVEHNPEGAGIEEHPASGTERHMG
ncbi:MAG TPA: F0F1 ATP synthase subunit A [Chloroflexia bacterium]|nr:F0F1 ATP synthase subunit A [Chloroflexia bacterium]